MPNVLHLLNYLGNGGTEVYIYSLAKKLHKKKCNFYVAYSQKGKGKDLFDELDVDMIYLDMKSPLDIKAAWSLKKTCEKLSIDIIHTHFLRENSIAILSKLLGNKPKIINTRHMLLENSKWVILANKILTKFNYKLIAVSSTVREQLLCEGITPSKIVLIHNGIDLNEWNSATLLTFRDEYSLQDDDIIITSVARFTEEKGHEFLIDSIKFLKNSIDLYNIKNRFKFVLVGDGILFDSIKKKAIELNLENDIIFTGFRRDIKNILKSSDIFVSHSKSEAFGISILEAIAAGLPIITTNSGGTKEIINKRFDNGILLDYGDKEKLVESLAILINNKGIRDKYINLGISVVQDHFDLEYTANNTFNLYGSK